VDDIQQDARPVDGQGADTGHVCSSLNALRLNRWLLALALAQAAVGFLAGLAVGLWIDEPAATARVATNGVAGKAELVLVVQTATPGAPAGAATAEEQPTVEVLPDVTVTQTLAGARPYLREGPDDAPVQLVVFSDPQCPFCRQLALGAEKQAREEFVRAGKAAITYRHYAFLGAESTRAAIALECAGKQGKLWAFHAQVYGSQLPENSGQLTDAKLLEWAKEAGLDAVALSACVADPAVGAQVEADLEAGAALGVRGTPVTFVNGQRIVGAVPYEVLKAVIDAELGR
jgi:protein-disulfide isomerase